MKKIIILVSGKAGAGKDTVGEYLVRNYGFTRYAFADSLKDIAKILGWDGQKDDRGRKLLQDLGSVARAYDSEFWIEKVIEKIKEDSPDKVVITDCRYANEYIFTKEFARENGYSFLCLKIKRDKYNLSPELANHESERYIDNIPGIVIENNGDFKELYSRIDNLMKEGIPVDYSELYR